MILKSHMTTGNSLNTTASNLAKQLPVLWPLYKTFISYKWIYNFINNTIMCVIAPAELYLYISSHYRIRYTVTNYYPLLQKTLNS